MSKESDEYGKLVANLIRPPEGSDPKSLVTSFLEKFPENASRYTFALNNQKDDFKLGEDFNDFLLKQSEKYPLKSDKMIEEKKSVLSMISSFLKSKTSPSTRPGVKSTESKMER
jgi:hypothetical protein